MKVLVTGATGYIGSILTRRLTLKGHDVTALGHASSFGNLTHSVVPHIRADIRDASEMRSILGGVEAVCHLAGLSSVRDSLFRSDEYQSVNVDGTLTLLRILARQTNRPIIFIYASTALVYGIATERPIPESTPRRPNTPYAWSKATAEEAVRAFSLAGAIAGVSLRLFNVAGAEYGLGDANSNRIVPKALAVAAGYQPVLPMLADGRSRHDFVHVSDVVDAFCSALHAARPGSFEAFNVGASPTSIRELVTVVETVTRRQIPTSTLPLTVAVPSLVAETRLIRQRLNWQPAKSSIERIVADAWVATHSTSPREGEAVQWATSRI